MIVSSKCQHCDSPVEAELEDTKTFGGVTCQACGKQTPIILQKARARRRVNSWWIIGGAFLVTGVTIAVAHRFPTVGIAAMSIGAVVVYFTPSILGLRKRNALAIVALNLFLGWSLVGWVVALVWSLTEDDPVK